MNGPSLKFSQEIHAAKYRNPGEDFRESASRVASALSDSDEHFKTLRGLLLDQLVLPAGRIQLGAGSARAVTLMNCYVMDNVPDSTEGIMRVATEAAMTMRMGGGVGYNFSLLRPNGSLIKSLQSTSTGPLAWMNVYDALCRCIASAGHRQGAQMGILRIDHPDIEAFIHIKNNEDKLRGFNLSIGVTDEFMEAVAKGSSFALRFEGVVHREVDARELWEMVMRSTWDWAEPGVIFLDTMNRMNNLWYCETLEATNPCAEQPLPPYGACLLGSLNLPKFLVPNTLRGTWEMDIDRLEAAVPVFQRALDIVIDKSLYPLPQQKDQMVSKRRMGIGITGLANCLEALGYPYGGEGFLEYQDFIESLITAESYRASARLALEKGAFPLYDASRYLESEFIKTLPEDVQWEIGQHGIRNSHLRSNAPTGTISMAADNVSSGIEPVYNYGFTRQIIMPGGTKTEFVEDYGSRVLGVQGKVSSDVTMDEHLAVLLTSQKNVDSAVSKTINHDGNVPWAAFKDVYRQAWEGGAKGCSTYNKDGKRAGIFNDKIESSDDDMEPLVEACYFDPVTGAKTCA